MLSQRYSFRKVCSLLCVIWAIIVMSTPACKDYGGILVNRFFLGVIEKRNLPKLHDGYWSLVYEPGADPTVWLLVLIQRGRELHLPLDQLRPWAYYRGITPSMAVYVLGC